MPFSEVDTVPAELRTAEFTLRPITAEDAELDYAAVVETREYLRLWEGSEWPEDDFTVAANRKDLVGLEERHAANRAYTYTVLSPDATTCLGCVYVFPTTASFLAKSTVTALGAEKWADLDAVVFFWARLSEMDKGMDGRLLAALRPWFREQWQLERTAFVVNERFEQQVALVEGTDLVRKFEFVEPDKPSKFLVYG